MVQAGIMLDVHGIDRVIFGLKRMIKGEYRNAIDTAIYKAADYARDKAPIQWGDLSSAIRVEKEGKLARLIIDDSLIPYAFYQEWGSSQLPVGTAEEPYVYTTGGGKIAYRPFLRWAVMKAAGEVCDDLRLELFKIWS